MIEALSTLRIGNGTELPLQASKWLDQQLLIDCDEMRALLAALGDFEIFQVGMVCERDAGMLSKEQFLSGYEGYVDCLKQGIIPDEKIFRPFFSSVFTNSREHLFRILLENNRHIIRVEKPVLQLQVNRIAYSHADGKFRGMVFGKESILWGIQISYPQLFQDANTKEVFTVSDNGKFPNTSLFRKLQLYLRQHTIPTPFQVGSARVNVPMRLGKQCSSWINRHPHLVQANIQVAISER